MNITSLNPLSIKIACTATYYFYRNPVSANTEYQIGTYYEVFGIPNNSSIRGISLALAGGGAAYDSKAVVRAYQGKIYATPTIGQDYFYITAVAFYQ